MPEAHEKCPACGKALAPNRAPGRRRKWCSNRCRRIALYAGTCERCGAATDGSNGPGKAPRFCIACLVHNPDSAPARNRALGEERAHEFLRLRREGRTNVEIAAMTGTIPQSVSRSLARLRATGIDVPRSRARASASSRNDRPEDS